MIKNYFKIAWRNTWLHRKISLINIIGLSIGMAAAVLIMLWVQNELSFDNYHKDADNIYRVVNKINVSKGETWLWDMSPYMLGDLAKKELPEVKNMTRIEPVSIYSDIVFHYNNLVTKEKKCAYVDEQWFNMFHYDVVDGDTQSFTQNPFSLIMTESTAKRYFGNREAVGQMIKVDTVNYQVRAVVKDNPANSSFQFDILMPLAARLADPKAHKNELTWNNYNHVTFLELQPGTSLKRIIAKLDQIIKNHKKGNPTTTALTALKGMHFEAGLQIASFEPGNGKLVKIFLILGILIIITACINYVNLTTARASARAKEVSMRKIVGAGRLHLFWQFMSESFLISLLSLAFAIILVQVCLPAFNSITGRHFVQPLVEPSTWDILIGTLFVCFIINGIYPALMLSSFKPINIFRGKNVLSVNDALLRKGLVVLQFTITVVLIIGTTVIYRQLKFMENVELGYNKSHVFEFNIPFKIAGFDDKKRASFIGSIKNELEQQSAIKEVSLSNAETFYNNPQQSSGSFDWAGRPKDFDPSFCVLSVDAGFPKMMELKLKEGRWFRQDGTDVHNVILNETAVNQIHLRQPILGQRFISRGDTGVIIGVAKDFYFRNLHEKIGPMIIDNHTDYALAFYVKTAPSNTEAAINAAQKTWNKFIPSEPFTFDFLDEGYNSMYRTEQRSSLLISLFAGIAILVSCMGLLGLVTFAAEQRVKEIGIRKVLGASIQHIVALLSADFVRMVLIASLVAFPIGWWAMKKWLDDFAYKVNISWWVFMLAGALALFIALVTVSIQAVRAATANPVNSLRNE